MRRAKERETGLPEEEKEIFGATHAELGGFLLDLWGLPEPVVEAITFHYYPSALGEDGWWESIEPGEDDLSPLTAVHVANYFASEEDRVGHDFGQKEIDTVYLERVGAIGNIERWRDLCSHMG